RTHDGGKSWQLIVAGLPANQSVNVVRADPSRKGLLYSGTERGVYLSFDDGDHWQSLQRNLPVTSVRDIAIHDADVVLATHGRGIYVMDDISALRQAEAKEESAKFWLFAPAPAYRVRLPEFTGTPMPKDEPMAPNPPLGAYLDYTLNTPPKSPISMDIFDANGGLVRHYSSADSAPPTDPSKLSTAPEWVQTPSTLSVQQGAHRFVWPLHYPAPVPAGKPDPWADGLWAPPGDYRVVLMVDGVKQERPLRVLADPRVHLPASAYAEQFALARSIQAQSERVASAARESDAMLHALDTIKAKGLSHEVETLRIRVQAISGTRSAPNPHNVGAFPPRDTKNFKFLAGLLMKLQSAVDGADAAPSIDAQNGFKALAPMVDAVLRAWDELKSRDLAALNARLKAVGMASIDLK
ncbi:MAG: hypothetical protein KGK05_08645, partial [Xanthomonadaceae bacterium]|nr:hypothetical protein [Xanthomonadaceae bacterium]